MEKGQLTVSDDHVISLEYVLTLEDGEEVDSATSDDAIVFLQGYGEVIPGLEQAIYGMSVGESKHIVVSKEEAYGDYDPEDTQLLPVSAFPSDIDWSEGLELVLYDEQDGEVIEATVVEIRDEDVLLDFNHPLAGETLHFEVKVVAIRQATDEELAHGHVHDDEDHH
jgi:FKBP-type peptidyl-prolyl cis-trans isomerase SlyD